jgi:hypothetical protein
MTTPAVAVEAVYQRWADNWSEVTAVSTFEDEEFEEPNNASWLRLSVRHLDRAQNTLGKSGNRIFRTPALVMIQVYTRTNTGVQSAHTLSKTAADIFEAESFSGLDFGAATTRESVVDGKWKQWLVEIPFDYDETK